MTMRRTAGILLAAATLVTATLVAGAGAAATAAPQEPSAGPATWELLRSLVGTWEGVYSDGSSARVTYRLISNGTALMETLVTAGSPDMVSIYHPDGSSLVMTHYCSEGNQPTLRLTRIDGRTLSFDLVRVTNLADPASGHITGLVLSLDGGEGLRQEWTSRHAGGIETGTFEFTRAGR